ncbi:5'-adenylylsulfate reductase-like [Actinidia chinensis var. chinensis]|uniref:5'-adenylylsulfate reductase-like n=1 Tax=Actinidia chinensis var. chinensis TaxID=1590841 RepID=A0A2R6R2U1_ACTCC|nr:5'-adenylylsulfate reductase-like [Actinidia chinensis var. chinensis]
MAVWEVGLVLLGLAVFGRLTCADPVRVPSAPVCPVKSVADSVLRFQDSSCLRFGDESVLSIDAVGVTEGDEVSLQRALSLVHKNSHDYVALLFYASWCPFSGTFRQTLSILSFLYPSIAHFAIEESIIRPSTLSKYGVHGFPTLFLLNSTMRIRYHGSRTLGSLIAFYSEVTDLDPVPLNLTSVGRIVEGSSDHEEHNNGEQEICPFSWARSPENLLRQETYLALATAFVILRLFYFIFPTLFAFAQIAWRRYILKMSWRTVFEHPLAYMNRAIQLFNSSLKEPCKRRNLHEGALNAKAWASKSLASVSFGDANTSRTEPVS